MQSELGVVGQKYENRKNKKTGILEERDEKKKQLFLRSDDGKSFIVMYSTFRSDWRKVNEGESEIKIEPADKPKPVKSEKKSTSEKIPKKNILSDKEHMELRMKVMDDIIEAVESAGLNFTVRITGKSKGIMVKNGRCRVMEVYVVNKDKVFYSVYFGKKLDLPKTYGVTYDYFESYRLQHRHRMDDLHLKEFINVLKEENSNKEEK